MTVSNVRNADGSVKARFHFAEKPDNPYLQKLIDGTQATAVTWEVQGLKPNATFEVKIWYVFCYGGLTIVNLETYVIDTAVAIL